MPHTCHNCSCNVIIKCQCVDQRCDNGCEINTLFNHLSIYIYTQFNKLQKYTKIWFYESVVALEDKLILIICCIPYHSIKNYKNR